MLDVRYTVLPLVCAADAAEARSRFKAESLLFLLRCLVKELIQ